MRHLKTVSYLITGLGVILAVVALILDLDPTVLLIGMMLVIAGGVKVVMVALWNGVARFGAPVVESETTIPARINSRQSTRKGGRP